MKYISISSFFYSIAAMIVLNCCAYGVGFEKAYASLQTNRDRLLTDYAHERNYMDAATFWNQMSQSEKGVFLTITDLLGRRSYFWENQPMHNYVYLGVEEDQVAGCAAMNNDNDCNNGCWFHPSTPPGNDPQIEGCVHGWGEACAAAGKCSDETIYVDRTDFDTVLNHVEKFYGILGSNSCGGSGNRIFFKADNDVIYWFRNIGLQLPYWRVSHDLAGPHDPFTQSRETDPGQPRGQTQQWAWDYEATPIYRDNFYNAGNDPHIVEIDIDYNVAHDSNPECSYGGVYGRTKYENYWYYRGLGGPADLGYYPGN